MENNWWNYLELYTTPSKKLTTLRISHHIIVWDLQNIELIVLDKEEEENFSILWNDSAPTEFITCIRNILFLL